MTDSERARRWREEIKRRLGTRTYDDAGRILDGAGGRKATSWPPVLSKLVNDAPGVVESELADDEVAARMGKFLGFTDAAGIRAFRQELLGMPAPEAADQLSVPGFEDLGPLPATEAWCPPTVGVESVRAGVPAAQWGVKLDLQFLTGLAEVGARPRLVVVLGPPRIGRTAVVRTLAGVLPAGSWATETTRASASVLVLDDWHRASALVRQDAFAWLARTRGTLIVTSASEGPVPPADTELDVVRLSPQHRSWARLYLGHLRGLAERRWARALPVDDLCRWIEDDPLAARFADRVDTLGLLARAALEGEAPPLRERRLLRVLLQTVGARLHVAGDDALRLAFETVGAGLVADLALAMLGSGALVVPKATACTLAATALAPFRIDAHAFGLIDALVRHGLLYDAGDVLAPSTPRVFAVALADRLQDHGRLELDRVGAAVGSEDWHDALCCVATEGDGDGLLRVLLEVDLPAMPAAISAMTRILASDATFGDAVTFNRAFERCLGWWTRWPTQAPTMSVTFPLRLNVERGRDEGHVGGAAPLLLLARAANRHRALPVAPASDALPPLVDRWLTLAGAPARGPHDVGFARTVALLDRDPPFHGTPFWERAEAAAANDASSTIGGMPPDAWAQWWRELAVPALRRSEVGRRILAGTLEGRGPTMGMYQDCERGIAIWTGELVARARAGDDGAADAVTSAMLQALALGGAWNRSAVRTVWGQVARLWRYIRPKVCERLCAAPLEEQCADEDYLAWVLGEVLDEPTRLTLWRRWTKERAEGHPNARITSSTRTGVVFPMGRRLPPPWKAYLRAGLPAVEVARWALARGKKGLADEPDRDRMAARLTSQEVGSLPSVRSRRREALDAVLAGGDLDALVFVARSTLEVASEAIDYLRRLDPTTAVERRIELAADQSEPVRFALLQTLAPEREEEWDRLMAAPQSLFEWIIRRARRCSTSEQPHRWSALVEALVEADEVIGGAESEEIKKAVAEHLWMAIPQVLLVLASAPRRDPEDRAEVTRSILGSKFLGPLSNRGELGHAWALAVTALSTDETLTFVAKDPTRLVMVGQCGGVDVLVAAVADPALSLHASRLLARLVLPDRAPLLRELAAPCLDQEAAVLLVEGAMRRDPLGTVDWLGSGVVGLPAEARLAWWERAVGWAPAGPARSRATLAWMEAREKAGS